MASTLSLAAPAKLNLYLHVVGRRPDGYHLLDGLVAFADIHDTLTLAPARALVFEMSGPFAGTLTDAGDNLVVKAAKALATAAGREADIALRLVKRLPVASGIGGGSADAAACLKGLASLWGIDPAGTVARDVAAKLGADVPACLDGRAAFIGGIGTELAPAPKLPPAWLVLVNPGIALPTPDVYRARRGSFSQAMRFKESPSSAADLAARLAERGNDLTAPAIALVPEIAEVLTAIAATDTCFLSRMSGSGATCFGIYESAGAAQRAASSIRRDHQDWWVAPGRLLEDTADLKPDGQAA